MISRLELPPREASVAPALGFLHAFAGGLGIPEDRRQHLEKATEIALRLVLEKNRRDGDTRVAMDISEGDGMVVVEVINRGVPLFVNGNPLFHEAAHHIDKISIENKGRDGQSVVLRMRLGEEAARRSLEGALGDTPELSDEEVTLRDLQPGEETSLSQLFYSVYGYDYIHEFVYYPEKLRQMREDGKLISIVAALPNGRLVGHVGLIQWGDDPRVFEPCLGVTDPAMKSRGLFSRVFAKTMERVRETPMQYCFFDFVTNHEFSQRLVAKYEPVDLALFVGCQSKATQARLEKLGMGQDPKETDRYSLLYSVIPQVIHPFGRQVSLPNNLGELLGFLLKPLNLTWVPSSRFELLPPEGDYQTHFQPAQNAVIFDMCRPGRDAAQRILNQWRSLMRAGYEYAAVDVPLDAPGLGNLYDLLAEHGFFVAGFLHYHYGARLAMRFQAMGPTKVSFEEIKVFTPTAKRLCDIIRANYERNQVL